MTMRMIVRHGTSISVMVVWDSPFACSATDVREIWNALRLGVLRRSDDSDPSGEPSFVSLMPLPGPFPRRIDVRMSIVEPSQIMQVRP